MFEPFVIHFLPSTVSDGDIHHGCDQRVEAEDAGTAGSNRKTEVYDVQRPTHPRSQKRNGNVSMYDLRNTPVVVEREEISRTPKGQEGRRRSSAPTIDGSDSSSANIREHRRFWMSGISKARAIEGQ